MQCFPITTRLTRTRDSRCERSYRCPKIAHTRHTGPSLVLALWSQSWSEISTLIIQRPTLLPEHTNMRAEHLAKPFSTPSPDGSAFGQQSHGYPKAVPGHEDELVLELAFVKIPQRSPQSPPSNLPTRARESTCVTFDLSEHSTDTASGLCEQSYRCP